MSTHTPAPWTLKSQPNCAGDGWTRIMHGNQQIAKITAIHAAGSREAGDFETEEANARLIAAAPELLDALKNALRELEWMDRNALIRARSGGDYIEVEHLAEIRAAILKAEG